MPQQIGGYWSQAQNAQPQSNIGNMIAQIIAARMAQRQQPQPQQQPKNNTNILGGRYGRWMPPISMQGLSGGPVYTQGGFDPSKAPVR